MRLRKIPIDFLWEGMELSGDIYNDRGSVLLLKRGEVLTQDRLDKLSKFERGGYITTSEETYQEILNRYASGFEVGARVKVWGRVQSREYTKKQSAIQH